MMSKIVYINLSKINHISSKIVLNKIFNDQILRELNLLCELAPNLIKQNALSRNDRYKIKLQKTEAISYKI